MGKEKKVKKEDKKSKDEEKKLRKEKKKAKNEEAEKEEIKVEKKAKKEEIKVEKKTKKEETKKEVKEEVKEEKTEKKAAKTEDDTFNVFEELVATTEETESRKRSRKEMTEEEKEEQRRINRESREKKKQKKDLNKRRKKGELTEEEDKKSSKIKIKPEIKPKEPEFGIWVGNLSYATTTNAVRAFFGDCGTITRVKCPSGNGVKNNNKGFAYVFFGTPEEQAKAVAKSEQQLEGRSLLIKEADNFERADGSKAPTEAEKKEIKKQKNPPCPTLFIGNLSFETTEKAVREAFEWAGDIRKIRIATFEDSGKCKGFGYVDFHTVEAATKAIRAPDKHTFGGRKCRVEFASEDAHMRSKPWLLREKKQQTNGQNNQQS